MDYIDIYCERIAPGLFAEPLNALTNLAFFVAARHAWILARREKALDGAAALLVLLLAAIGAASGAFHTLATLWAMLADSLSILFYQVAYIFLYARRVMRLGAGGALALLGSFVALTLAAGEMPKEWLNGSLSYIPAVAFLCGLGIWHRLRAARERNVLLAASGVFLVSLVLRTSDMALCPVLPAGLHFLWHVLNGIVLYITLRAYILNAEGKRYN